MERITQPQKDLLNISVRIGVLDAVELGLLMVDLGMNMPEIINELERRFLGSEAYDSRYHDTHQECESWYAAYRRCHGAS